MIRTAERFGRELIARVSWGSSWETWSSSRCRSCSAGKISGGRKSGPGTASKGGGSTMVILTFSVLTKAFMRSKAIMSFSISSQYFLGRTPSSV